MGYHIVILSLKLENEDPGFSKDVHERMTGRDVISRNDLSWSFFTDKMTINFNIILLICMFVKKWVASNVEDCLVIVAPCLYLMKAESENFQFSLNITISISISKEFKYIIYFFF
jgi:hypothetical protein